MMSVHCPRHGHEVLLGHRQVLGIEGRGAEMTVRWVCWCGQQGTSQPQARTAPAVTIAPAAAA